MGGYVPLNLPRNQSPSAHPERSALPFSKLSMENDSPDSLEQLNEEFVEAASQEVISKDNTLDYFEKDGQGFLVSKNPDYRGKDKKTQQERFILLYVWAYHSIYQEAVPNKKHLSQAAQKNGIYSKNFSTYTNEISNRFFIKSDGTLKLNPTGSKEIEKLFRKCRTQI